LRLLYDTPTRWNSAYDMIERAVHLRRAINKFVSEEPALEDLTMSNSEWDQCQALLKILYPFKVQSTRIQRTDTPTIERVYPTYEHLWNEIEDVEEWVNVQTGLRGRRGQPQQLPNWATQLNTAVTALGDKLREYYTAAQQPVFSEAVLLDPSMKSAFFQAGSFQAKHTESGKTWQQKYIDDARTRFLSDYSALEIDDYSITGSRNKRKWVDDDDDDIKITLLDRMTDDTPNDFDRYLLAPRSHERSALEWWKKYQHEYPGLARMARDVFAVPASGAGVEREFSKGGRVATWTRARLNPDTIQESMMFKSYLARTGKALEEMDPRQEGLDDDDEEDTDLLKMTKEFYKSSKNRG